MTTMTHVIGPGGVKRRLLRLFLTIIPLSPKNDTHVVIPAKGGNRHVAPVAGLHGNEHLSSFPNQVPTLIDQPFWHRSLIMISGLITQQ